MEGGELGGADVGGHGIRIVTPLSQTTLAGMVGASRENVNRALRALSVAGYVRVTGKTIVVTGVGALRALSGGGHRATYRRNIRSSADGVRLRQ